jgi:PST family polysaccharide transporter
MKIDQIMLGCMVDHTILGAYSAALRLVEPFYFIATAVATSILPPLTRIKQNDSSQGYLDKLQIVYDAMTAVALPVVLVLSLCAHFIISCVYGAQYAGSEQVLRIYAWSLIPIFWGVISSQHLLVTKKVHVSFYRTFIGGLVNVALNFLLIPLYGGNGAAWASLIAYTTATLTIGLFHESQQVRMMLISLFPWPRRWTLTIH